MSGGLGTVLIWNGRATEWITSSALLGFALTLALPGDTFAGAGFRSFREVGLDEAAIATPLALVAGARMVALLVNGHWQRTPLLRMFGAAVGAAIFAMLSVGFGWPYLAAALGYWGASAASTGAATYAVLAAADLLSAFRAGLDFQQRRRDVGSIGEGTVALLVRGATGGEGGADASE